MHSKWVFKHFCPHSGKRNFLLFLIWVIGLLLGTLLCNFASFNCIEFLYEAVSVKPSIPGLLLVCTLPVALSSIAICSRVFLIAYLLVFLNAISLGFCGTIINISFGSSAWIIRPMLLLSSGCASVLMWWLLLQNNLEKHNRKHIRLALIISCLVCILDFLFISPFVGDLIKVL